MSSDSAARIVRERLAAADRLRRGREAMRQVWRTAPIVAASGLGLAALSRWGGLPAGVPLAVLIAGTAALVVFFFVRRRERPVSDAAAAAIDKDARMSGELRSANWFGAREQRDSWADFHVARAAEHLQGIDWIGLYPAIRSTRAQVATAVLATATIVIIVTMPERLGGGPAPTAVASDTVARREGDMAGRMLDPELQRQLEALLAAAASGTLPTAEALASDAAMRDMLDKLSRLSDAALLEALKRALAANPDAGSPTSADNIKRLADEARQAAEAGTLPQELQKALEKLSDEIELAKSEDGAPGEDATAASSAGSEGRMGEADGEAEELSIQFAKAAEAGGGAGVMMMAGSEPGQPGGSPGAGVGGAGSEDVAGSTAAIEAALKQESVEASQDNPGDNVDTDIRRKTEHGNATVAFTGSRAATFDRTRATAPPPMPEGRRTGVQTYFVRTPQ